jgi:hypothetical protein
LIQKNEITLEQAVMLGLLSAQQVSIVMERNHDLKGAKSNQLRNCLIFASMKLAKQTQTNARKLISMEYLKLT